MRVLVVVGVLVGSIERIVVWRSHLGALDGDEAVWGLMARHVADGELTAFMWGQAYGGTLETVLSAPLLAAFPGSTVALRIVPVALTAIAAVLVWRVGRRTIGEPAATAAGVLFWLWPAYAIWKSSRAHGFYGSGLVLALLVLLLVLRLYERPTRRDAVLLGLVVGVGLWQTAQLLPIALVAALWLIWQRPATLRLAPLALTCAFAGFLPWIVSNVRHDWWSFSFPPGAGTFASRLRGTVNGALPMAFGLRVPFDLAWVGGVAIGGVAMLALYAGLVIVAVRTRRTPVSLLVVVAVVFPLIAATSTFTWIVDEPRYLYILSPVLVLLVAVVLTSWQRAAAAVAVAVSLTAFGLVRMGDSPQFQARADGMFVPADFGPLEAELERLGVDRVFADYWVAYRLDFATDEKIIAAESPQERYTRIGRKVVILRDDHVRYEPYVTEVTRSPRPGHVVIRGSVDESKVDEPLLRAAGYRRSEAGGFVIWYLPTSR
jgi:Dolichyl-phosphate-mannose-protein mannosyltransferase